MDRTPSPSDSGFPVTHRVRSPLIAAAGLWLACLAPHLALAQSELYVHDIGGFIRVYQANPDPNNTDQDHILFPAPVRSLGGGSTKLDNSGGIALDPANSELIAGSLQGNEVVVFDLLTQGDGAPKRVIGGAMTGINRPFGVALDPARDEIVVANQDAGTLTFYGLTDQGNVAPRRTVAGLDTPQYVTVAQTQTVDQLIVRTNTAVLVFDRTAGGGVVGPVRTITAFLDVPTGVAFDPVTDEIYVANSAPGAGFTGAGFVTVYRRSDGAFQRMIGPHPQLAFARAVAIDTNEGEVHVATFFPAAVAVFNRAGAWLRTSVLEPTVFEPFFVALRLAPASSTSLVTAVLPSGRAVMTGVTASAFVTIINTGTALAQQVGISLATVIPATLEYHQTNPLTNEIIPGTLNTPADIPVGGNQTYVIFITPTGTFGPTNVVFNFFGFNTSPVPALPGINTLLLSASTTPVADAVALVATLSNDGILHIPGAAGAAAFAVAMSNVGASDTILVSAETTPPGLPVHIDLCLTDAATGQCITSLAPTVTVPVGSGVAGTFGVFVTASGVVPLDPAANRIFIIFTAGFIVGRTSVAVTTE